MKKLFTVLLAAMMLLAMVACGNDTPDPTPDTKTLYMATEVPFAPYEYYDGDKLVGIDVDVANAIAEKLGMKLEVVDIAFDSIVSGVQAGKYDVGMSGISITEKRQKNALFTDPYCLAAQAIVVTADSPITCKADLEGKKVSVQTGTTAEEYCMGNGYEVLAFTANNDAASALTSGKVDAWVVDNEVALAMAPDLGLTVLDEAMTAEPYAFAFQKGSELVAPFNEALDALLADGTVEKIFSDYGVTYVGP